MGLMRSTVKCLPITKMIKPFLFLQNTFRDLTICGFILTTYFLIQNGFHYKSTNLIISFLTVEN